MPHQVYRTTLWLLDQTHIIITTLTALTFLTTRSVEVGYFILGAVGLNGFAKILKNIIRQDRPMTTIDASADLIHSDHDQVDPGSPPPSPSTTTRTRKLPKKKVKRTYGMPSTHSTSIGYYMSYLFLTLPSFHPGTSATSSTTTLQGPLGSLLNLLQLVWGTAIIHSRVTMGYHTIPQVVVGSVIGLVGGWLGKMGWEEGLRGGRGEEMGEEWVRWGFGLGRGGGR